MEYYLWFERENAKGVSEEVLADIVRGPQLDDAVRDHLYDLVRAANESAHTERRRSATRASQLMPSLQHLIDAIADVRVVIENVRWDILAMNRLGRTVFSEMYVHPQRPANFGRFVFLDLRADGFQGDRDDVAVTPTSALKPRCCRRSVARCSSPTALSPSTPRSVP